MKIIDSILRLSDQYVNNPCFNVMLFFLCTSWHKQILRRFISWQYFQWIIWIWRGAIKLKSGIPIWVHAVAPLAAPSRPLPAPRSPFPPVRLTVAHRTPNESVLLSTLYYCAGPVVYLLLLEYYTASGDSNLCSEITVYGMWFLANVA